MDQGVSLEKLADVDFLWKNEFYRMITGQELDDYKFNLDSPELPSFSPNVRKDNSHLVMEAVEKFGRMYGNVVYYQVKVNEIRYSYKKDDFETFHRKIGDLLLSIAWD